MLRLENRSVVVIGGGAIATRKISELLPTGARVTVVSPATSPRLRQWIRDGRIRHRARVFRPGDLAGADLTVAATSNPDEQARIARAARRAGTWVNVVDRPDLCDFIAPAVLRRGHLTIAVSTGGRNPALAAWLKRQMESSIGSEYGRLTTVLAAVRRALQAVGVPPAARRRMVVRLMDANLLDHVRSNDRDRICRLIRRVTGLNAFTLPPLKPRTGRSAHVATHARII